MADPRTLEGITLIVRNDTASKWEAVNPVLAKGEMGVELDTLKIKFGDGATSWNDLKYSNNSNTVIRSYSPTEEDTDYDLGTFWINIGDEGNLYVLFAKTDDEATWIMIPTAVGEVNEAKTAEKLKTARGITLKGDVVEVTEKFDGSGDISFDITLLSQSGLAEGTYTKLTVNSKGIVTAAEKLSVSDLPDDIPLDKISGLGSAASKDIGTDAGEIPVLDENGKIDSDLLPAYHLTNTYVVNSEEAMLALDATTGDVAIRTDLPDTFILQGTNPADINDWQKFEHPGCNVESVNGKTGVITLNTDDIKEGAENQYFTKDRVIEVIEETEVSTLKNGEDVLMSTDTFVLDCGNAEK